MPQPMHAIGIAILIEEGAYNRRTCSWYIIIENLIFITGTKVKLGNLYHIPAIMPIAWIVLWDVNMYVNGKLPVPKYI